MVRNEKPASNWVADPKLRHAVLANALFSGVCGFALLLFAEPSNSLMGTDAYVADAALAVLGGLLSLYALGLCAMVAARSVPLLAVRVVIVLDLCWVLGSIALLAAMARALSPWGRFLIAGVAACVAILALVQWLTARNGSVLGRAEPIGYRGVLREIGRSWLALKRWVKVWLFLLNAVFLAAFFFLSRDPIAATILWLYLASGPFLLIIMVFQRGLSRLLGTAHLIPWLPLLGYLLLRLSTDIVGPRVGVDSEPILFLYSVTVTAVLAVCLGFDLYDLRRWMKGETALIGSESQ